MIKTFMLKKERNEYGKAIRKLYESHRISEKRQNMVNYNIRTDDICNTISTVEKDTYMVEIWDGK